MDDGHVFAPAQELIATCIKEIGLSEELLSKALESLQETGRIVREDEAIYLRGLYQKEFLYTAITRARRLAVLVGSPKAIAIAVRNQKAGQRHTALGRRLQ